MNGSDQGSIPLTGDKALMADSGREAPLQSGFKMTLTLGPAGAILIAILGLLSYVPGLRLLGSIRPDYIPMAPSTAASFLILGAVLLCLSRMRRPSSAAKTMIALVILVMLFSLLNVAGNITGMELNFEARLSSGAGTINGIPLSRMSPLTGAAFMLAGLGILLLLARSDSAIPRRLGHYASSLGVLTVLGGSTVLLAYLYGSPLMYSGTSVPMAATTAIAFVLLGAAVAAAAGPESLPLRLVCGDSTAARLSRVFFPLTVAVVILQGLLSHMQTASTVIHNALFLAFLAIAAGTLFVAVIIRVAHSLGGSMDKASERLLEREARLSKTQEMAHVGSWELDIATRQLIWSDEVYRIFGLQPQEFPATYEAFLSSIHPQDRGAVDSAYTQSIQAGADSYEIDHRVVRQHSGELRFVHEKCEHLRDASGRIVRSVGMVHDISERKRSEEEIKRQLAEKEILLKEVHHRIKNNIASISGFLSLRLQSINNPEAVAALQDAIGRVNSMRILYDKLLLGKGYEDISVKNYVESLADGIVAMFPDSARVTVEKNIADFHLDTKRLFPLGLIINELITNKMKYAFMNRESGRIRISLTLKDNLVRLVLQDDGVGLPDGFDLEKSRGFGLMLVKMLSQQLGGSFAIETHAGARCIVEFNV